MDFKKQLKAKTKKVDEYLHKILGENTVNSKVHEAMEYSLFAGGKRVRPIISMAVCEMLEEDEDKVLPFACAIELIHTYSLIHDDLPCMDDDKLRRGKPCCHIKFGEDIALLAGDALQSLAFEIMSQADNNPHIVLECIRTVSVSSGIGGMVLGQELDINGERETAEQLQKLNLLKTGALIAASAWVGAIVGGADMEQYKAIGGYAKNIGLAFQVKDDILDVSGNSIEMGKNTGNDEEKNKQTFATLLGLEKAESLLEELTEQAKFDIHTFGEKSYFLQDLANYLFERKK